MRIHIQLMLSVPQIALSANADNQLRQARHTDSTAEKQDRKTGTKDSCS